MPQSITSAELEAALVDLLGHWVEAEIFVALADESAAPPAERDAS